MSSRVRVVVYSDNRAVRRRVIGAVGTHLDPYDIAYVEVATPAALVSVVESGGVDLAVLDAEARPAGGLGLARQLTDEVSRCPALLLIVARDADVWLASWSRADAVHGPRYTPTELADSVIRLLHQRPGVTSRSVP